MNRIRPVAILLCSLIPLFAADEVQRRTASSERTIYVDKMDGLESYVEKALQAAELPFDFIEEQSQPDFKATLGKLRSGLAEIHYKVKLGRNEDHILELRNLTTGKIVASHSFALRPDAASRTRAAEIFAQAVAKAYAKKKF
jgi:hypothetical protein